MAFMKLFLDFRFMDVTIPSTLKIVTKVANEYEDAHGLVF